MLQAFSYNTTKRWFFITIFFVTSLFSSSLELHRTLFYDNLSQTTHFDIYWSNDYPQNDVWLSIKNGSPKFVESLKTSLEDGYALYQDENISLPKNINVYILNTSLSAVNPPLTLNDISSLGAFTSDELPEILINANVNSMFINGKYLSYAKRLQSITLHELMHAHQYNRGLIDKEKSENDNLWFIEGVAVGFELYHSEDLYFRDFTTKYLAQNLNKGFLYDDYYLAYTAGLFFEFMVKHGYATFEELDRLYNKQDARDYLQLLAKKNAKNIYDILYEFYKELNLGENSTHFITFGGAYKVDLNSTCTTVDEKAKNIEAHDYMVGSGEAIITPYDNLQTINIKKGWNIYGYNFEIKDTTLNTISGIIWQYKDLKWSCTGDDAIKAACKENYALLENIDPNEGFWVYASSEQTLNENKEMAPIYDNYITGWNLSANTTDKNITVAHKKLIWTYDTMWHNSYEENITIHPNEGFWIKY